MTRQFFSKTPALMGVLIALLMAPVAFGYLDNVEGAAEVESLKLSPNVRQTVYARRCDQCPMLSLSVDKTTEFYEAGRAVALDQVAGRAAGATVLFNPASKKVIRVIFW